jgi:N-acetylglucosaminyldiphosphoundecaprenol N-acetyl-beta-D-mannosaminyltransferase
MQALDASASQLRPAGAAAAAGLALLISFLTPYLVGRRMRQLAREESGPGIRPRRQWAVSGLGIMLSFALPLLLFGGESPQVRACVIVSVLAGLAGLANDAFALPKIVLLVAAIGIAAIGAALGIAVTEVKPPFTTAMIRLGAWSIPASMAWLMAVAYAVILLRRLPRLTAGAIAMIAATFAIAALAVGGSRAAPTAGLVGLVMAAAAAGALRRDYPALGSSAHWAMGFALGAITIVGMLKNTAFLVLGVPLLALGVPVGETTYAVVYRFGRGRPSTGLPRPCSGQVGAGQRLALDQRWELLHEALIRSGVSPARTVLLFHLATCYLCLVALALVLIVKVTFLAKLAMLVIALAFGFAVFFVLARLWSKPVEAGGERVDMFGVPLARIDMAGALERIDQFVEDRSPHMVITSDTPSIVRAHDDAEYQEIVRAADMVTADGRGVVWMARVLGLPVRERVSGVDLVQSICERAIDKGYSVYLLGAMPGVAEEAAQALASRCSGLRIAGTHHGYFTAEEEPAVIRRIAEAKPDILFVALGAPRQERWIRQHMAELQAPVAIGVGGTFDVLAGRVPRAPEWMQRAGLEWLYRVLREPKRLPRMWALPRLVWMTLWEALRRR